MSRDRQVKGVLVSYTQLSQEQRYQIHSLLKIEHKQTEITECLGLDKLTVSRELHRKLGLKGYQPRQAIRRH